jgi:hypothetical protein
MRKLDLIILALVALYPLAAPLAWGQVGNPPATTKESGATSGRGMTAIEQTSKGGGGSVNTSELLQLPVLRFRRNKDGNVRVGVFPESEEILVGGTAFL